MNNRLRNKNVSFQHSGVVSIGTCIYFLNPISITNILGSAIPNFDGRGSFIALDRYHRGQFCKDTCANNDFEELTAISVTQDILYVMRPL